MIGKYQQIERKRENRAEWKNIVPIREFRWQKTLAMFLNVRAGFIKR